MRKLEAAGIFGIGFLAGAIIIGGLIVWRYAVMFRDESSPNGTPVSVGMAYHEDAWPVLSSAGGMHVDMDTIRDTDTHVVEVCRFPNGTVALLEICKECRTITELKVCNNPGQPEEKLTWRSVKEFYVGSD